MVNEDFAIQQADLSKQWKNIKEQLWLRYYKVVFSAKDKTATVSKSDLRVLHDSIKTELEKQRTTWKGAFYPFYQGYQRIGINGLRNTEKRVANYNLLQYLNATDTVLDIGCNTGYIALEISKNVAQVEGLEINPHLINVANLVKNHLQITNARFVPVSFEEFKGEKQYSVILSLASHETWDNNSTFTFNEYVEKMVKLCAPQGLLIFESHDLTKENMPKMLSVLLKYFDFELQKKLEKEHRLMPERMLLVLRKKE